MLVLLILFTVFLLNYPQSYAHKQQSQLEGSSHPCRQCNQLGGKYISSNLFGMLSYPINSLSRSVREGMLVSKRWKFLRSLQCRIASLKTLNNYSLSIANTTRNTMGIEEINLEGRSHRHSMKLKNYLQRKMEN